MLRTILCGIVGLAIVAGCHQASNPAKQKMRGRGTGVRGTVARVDVATGSLTLIIRNRQDEGEVEKTFQVDDDTTVTSYQGEAKKELRGRAGLSDPQFKEGSRVAVTTSEDGNKVLSIQVGDLPRRGRKQGGQRAN